MSSKKWLEHFAIAEKSKQDFNSRTSPYQCDQAPKAKNLPY